jgi:hypothetical protein
VADQLDRIEVFREGQAYRWVRLDLDGRQVDASPPTFITAEDARREGKRSNPDAIPMLLVSDRPVTSSPAP